MGKLTIAKIFNLGEGKHGDGNGLYLQARGASRSWLFRYVRSGKEHWIGLGPYPAVTIGAARAKVMECRMNLGQTGEPRPAPLPPAPLPTQLVTLAEASKYCLEAKAAHWKGDKHRKDWAAFMDRYVLPKLGNLPVSHIDTDAVFSVVSDPSRARSVLDQTVRHRLSTVLAYATARGWRDGDNPARWSGHLEHIVPHDKRRQVPHHAAVPWADMREFMAALNMRCNSMALAASALKFSILTAARSSEVRYATMDEIDLVYKIWTVPAERSKTGKPHRVPLTDQALKCIGRGWGEDQTRLFPGKNDGSLSHSAMLSLMARMGWGDYTAHGFRSTFRDWVAEATDFAGELAELSLAHSVMGRVEGAYRRGDQLDRRRPLMQAWADYCCNPRAEVMIPCRKTA